MIDNKRKLYDALSKDYDLGTFEQFSNDIADEKKRKRLYDATSKEYDYGDFDSFSGQLGFSKETPVADQTQKVTGSQSPVEQIRPSVSPTVDMSVVEDIQTPEPEPEPAPTEKKGFFQRLAQSAPGAVMGTNSAYKQYQYNEEPPTPMEGYDRHDELRDQLAYAKESVKDQLNEVTDESYRRYEESQKNKGFFGKLLDSAKGATMDPLNYASVQTQEQFGGGKDADLIIKKNTLDATQRALKSSEDIIKEADINAQNGKGSSFIAGAGRGFGNKAFDPATWDMGLSDANDGAALLLALDNADKGTLTPEQKALLDAKALELATNAYFGSYLGFGYKAGQVTGESLPFMVEMAINPASAVGTTAQARLTKWALKKWAKKEIANLVETGGSAIAREAVEKYGRKAVESNAKKYVAAKVGARVAGDIVGSALMAGTTGAVGVLGDTYNRMAGNVEWAIGEDGNIVYNGHDEGDEFGTALAKSFGARTIENHSEMLGEYFEPILGVAGNVIRKGAKSKLGTKLGLKSVMEFIDGVNATDLAKLVDDVMEQTKWNGTIGEFTEEILGNIENAIVVGDEQWNRYEYATTPDGKILYDEDGNPVYDKTKKNQNFVFNGEKMIETFLGVGLMGGAISGVKTAGYRPPHIRAGIQQRKAGARGNAIFGDEKWGQITDQLNGTNDANIIVSNALALVDNEEDKTRKKAILNYAGALINVIGVQKGEQMRREDENSSPLENDTRSSYENGRTLDTPQDKNDALNMYHQSMDRLEELGMGVMDEQTGYQMINQTQDPEARKAIIDYLNAKATYEGMLDVVREDMEAQIDASNATVDSNTNVQTGNIQPATLKDGDKRVYIVSGNVVMNEGSVDMDNSSESIIVRNADTGKIEMMSPSDIASLEESIDAQSEKDRLAQDIRNTIGQTAADQIEGKIPTTEGATFDVDWGDSGEATVTVVAVPDPVTGQIRTINPNGSVNVQMKFKNGLETEVTAMPADVLQTFYDARQKRRLEEHNAEQQMRDEQTRQALEEETITENTPDFQLNDELTMNIDGQIVRGSVQEIGPDGILVHYEDGSGHGRIKQMSPEELTRITTEVNSTPVAEPIQEMQTADEEQRLEEQIQNEQIAQAEAQKPAIERIPTDAKGDPIFDQAPVEDTISALNDLAEGDTDMARSVAEQMLADAKKALERTAKEKPAEGASVMEKMNNLKAHKQKVAEAQRVADYWQSVLDYKPTEQTNEVATEEPVSAPEIVEIAQDTQTAPSARSEQIQTARENVDTEPTEGQKKAGNYRMGHVNIDGYNITIENPRGSVRSGKDASGKEWRTQMNNDYGYIRGTQSVDGDHIDIFLSDNPSEGDVYVVDQVDPKTGKFDEHKVMYGFTSEEEARNAYLSNYEEGWQGLGKITRVSKEQFKKWVDSSHRKTKPFAEYAGIQTSTVEDSRPLTDAERSIGEKFNDIQSKLNRLSTTPAQRRELLQQKTEVIRDFISTFATDPAVVMTYGEASEMMKANGVSDSNIAEFENALMEGASIGGFCANGKIFIIADDIMSLDVARRKYVHERQHLMTTKGMIDDVLNAVKSRKELQDAVANLVLNLDGTYGDHIYDNSDNWTLADEYISHAMELAYSVPESGVADALREKGITNESLINLIKNIDHGQREDRSLDASRRDVSVSESDARAVGRSSKTQGRRSGEVERARPQRSPSGESESGRSEGIVVPSKLTEEFDLLNDEISNSVVEDLESFFECEDLADRRNQFIQDFVDKFATAPAYCLRREGLDNELVVLGVHDKKELDDIIKDYDDGCGGLYVPSIDKILLFSENIGNLEDVASTYVHERQHKMNNSEFGAKQLAKIASEAGTRENMLAIIDAFGGDAEFYRQRYESYDDTVAFKALADEISAFGMERLYRGQSVWEPLYKNGLRFDGIIKLLNEENNEQRNNHSLARSRRSSLNGIIGEKDSRQDDGTAPSRANKVQRQGPRSAEGREEGTSRERRMDVSDRQNEGETANGRGEVRRGSQKSEGAEGLTHEQNAEITASTSGAIDVNGHDAPMRFSMTAQATGAGLVLSYNKDKNNEPIGDVFMTGPNGKVYNSKNHVKVADIKKMESPFNYMIADALKAGSITDAQAKYMYDNYVSMLNAILDKGVESNGLSGYDHLSSAWQYEASTVQKSVSPNGDSQYLYSIDITKVCKKNEAIIKAISAMQRKMGYGVTPGQILDLYMSTIEEGFQVPCPVCYVFSRYIDNGKYASIAINGKKKYAKITINLDGKDVEVDGLADPTNMSDAEKEARIKFWQEEYQRQADLAEKYKKPIADAKTAIKNTSKTIDILTRQITESKVREANGQSPTLTPEQMERKMAQVDALNERYKAALDLVAQTSLTSWIKSFALKKAKGGDSLWEDSYQGFPDEYALDLRLTDETIQKYPAVQRLRKSGGSAAGKEIGFESDNAVGDILSMLGASNLKDAQNYYQLAVEEKDPEQKQKLLDKATKRFEGARTYALRQSLRGGQRMWSWSDNIERLAPDVWMNIMQVEMLGGAIQSYSKQLEGINLVARMGAYVNGSLMGKGIGYTEVAPEEVKDGKYTGKDITETDKEGKVHVLTQTGAPVYQAKDGKFYTLIFDDVVGIQAFTDPTNGKKGLFDLNHELDKAGNILVGMNDLHVLSAMADDRVYFIIPWHASGMSTHILKQMLDYLGVDLENFTPKDFTRVQEEKFALKEPEKNESGDTKKKRKTTGNTFNEGEDDIEEIESFTLTADGRKVINKNLIKFWEDHNYEDKYKSGLGHIPSGAEDGTLDAKQIEYKELRDAILAGFKDGKKTYKIGTPEAEAFRPGHMDKIKNDEFLAQVLRKINDYGLEEDGMTNGDTGFIYPYEYWDEKSTYKKADVNGERYLEYCRRLGYKPKFVGMLGNNPEKDFGNFADAKGYWKLLIDRRMYDVNDEFQDLDPVRTKDFTPDLVDPAKTGEQFNVTKVATNEGNERIADRAIEVGNKRAGGEVSVNYDKTLEQSVSDFRKSSNNSAIRSAKKDKLMFSKVTRERTDEQKTELFDKAKEIFGTTTNYNTAGYLLPDGSMLDFSGYKQGSGNRNSRGIDHREVANYLWDEAQDNENLETNMLDFMNQGAVRMEPEIGGINFTKPFTKAIKDVVRKYIDRLRGEVIVSIDASDTGTTMGYKEYDRGTSTEEILHDISEHWNGKPLGDFTTRGELRFSKTRVVVGKTAQDAENRVDVFRGDFGTIQDLFWNSLSQNAPDEVKDVYERAFRDEFVRAYSPSEKKKATASVLKDTAKRLKRQAQKFAKAPQTSRWNRVIAEEFAKAVKRYEDAVNDPRFVIDPVAKTDVKAVSGGTTLEHLTDLFHRLNSDKEIGDLFEKVHGIIQNLPIDYSFSGRLTRTQGQCYYQGKIVYSTNAFNRDDLSDQEKAHIILHEMIHGVTQHMIYAAEHPEMMSRYGKSVSKAVDEAVQELQHIWRAVANTYNSNSVYGATNMHEMVAEMSNLKFREQLKDKTLWDRLKTVITNLLNALANSFATGKKVTLDENENALTRTDKALNTLLDNFDADIYNTVTKLAKFGYALRPEELAMTGTVFSGGGLIEAGLTGLIDPRFAVEYNDKIAGVYADNHGSHIMVADIRDVDMNDLAKKVDGQLDFFHASPVCKRYSAINNNQGEIELDLVTAQATADIIRSMTPRNISVENVAGYKNSDAMKLIADALNEIGYNWDMDVYDASDFGSPTSRKRLIVRAKLDGLLPAVVKNDTPKVSWDSVTEDLFDTLEETKLAPWMKERLAKAGIDPQNIDKPLFVFGAGDRGGKIRVGWAGAPLPTITASGYGDRIIMPDGRVLKVNGRVLARIMGLPDTYRLPESETLAHTVLGNGVPTDLTRAVIAPLIDEAMDESNNEPVLLREDLGEDGDPQIRFSKVTDPDEIERFNKAKKIITFRSMQLAEDGSLLPPMAAKVGDKVVEGLREGDLEKSEEHPDKAIHAKYEKGPKKGQYRYRKNGEPVYVFKLDKATKDDAGKKQGTVNAAYDPYLHSSNSPLNDQFSSAWKRNNLVTVEMELSVDDVKSKYKAEKAYLSTGKHSWKSGPVGNALTAKGEKRYVYMTQYGRIARIIPTEEWADKVAELLLKHDLGVPFNCVSVNQREALIKRGVRIEEPQKGNAGAASRPAYEEWKKSSIQFSRTSGDLRDAVNPESIQRYKDRLKSRYSIAGEEIRRKINDNAIANGLDWEKAIMDELASYAEKDNLTKNEDLFLKNSADALTPRDPVFGNKRWYDVTPNEYRYLAWKANQKDNGAFSVMDDVLMQRKLNVGDFKGMKESKAQRVDEVQKEMAEIRKKAQADGTYLKAPNGEDSLLPKGLWELTRTKNFKNWFGDWEKEPENASRVVDRNGEPRVMFHGSRNFGFDTFNTQNGDEVNTNLGSHFGTATAAEEFDDEGNSTYRVFLNLRNPFRTEDIYAGDQLEQATIARDLARQIRDMETIQRLEELAPNLSQFEDYNGYWDFRDSQEWGENKGLSIDDQKAIAKILRELIIANGYDGVVYENVMEDAGEDSYIAFYPEQIKSVDNNGRFDPSDGRIQFSKAGKGFGLRNIISNFVNHGKRSNENTDGGSERNDRSAVAGDISRRVKAESDLGDIRMYREGLATSTAQYSPSGETFLRSEEVGQEIIRIAKDSGNFTDWKDATKDGHQFKGNTRESIVFYMDDHVKKLKDPFATRSIKGNNPLDAIYEHVIHNILFPNTAYTFKGITEDYKGDMRFIVEQSYVPHVDQADQNDVRDFLMNTLGLKDEGREQYGNDYLSILDAYGENVLTDGKQLFFIDPIIKLKKSGEEVVNWLLGNEDRIKFSKAYHGSKADFDQFSLEHALEGEGAMVHGYGHYVALNESVGKKYAQTLGEYGLTYDGLYPINGSKERAVIDDIIMKAQGNPSMSNIEFIIDRKKNEMKDDPDAMTLLNNIDASDFEVKQNRYLYTIEIPDDNGHNYIHEMKTLDKADRKRIADHLKTLPESLLQRTAHGPNWLPNGWTTVANAIEKNAYAGLEIRERLFDATGSEKKVSKILSDAGFVGMKYDGTWDRECAVIFNDKDMKMTDKIRFSRATMNYEEAQRVTNAEGVKTDTANLLHRLHEAYQDSMLALEDLQKAVEAQTGKIEDFENAYLAENAMSSKNNAMSEKFLKDFYEPMKDEIGKLIKDGVKYEDIIKYLIAKHGLERNEKFARRDAKRAVQKLWDEFSEKWGGMSPADIDQDQMDSEEQYIKDLEENEYNNNLNKDYSGLIALTEDDTNFKDIAEMMVHDFEITHNTDDLWKAINGATKETLRINYASGFLARANYEEIRDMFDYYIPLRGWEEGTTDDMYNYIASGKPAVQSVVRGAKGRTSLADDPIATIGNMADSAISQGNKNLMKQKFLNLAMNHDTRLLSVSEQWYTYNPSTKQWEAQNPSIPADATPDEVSQILEDFEQQMNDAKKNGTAKKQKGKLDLVKPILQGERSEHAVHVYRGGKEYIVYVNGNPRAAQAVNGLTNPEQMGGKIVEYAKAVKNFMANMFTSKNPAFIVTNASRDLIWAGVAVGVKESGNYSRQYQRNLRHAPKIFGLVKKYQNGTLDMNVPIERYFHEFISEGGETGYTAINSVEKYKRDMRRFEADIKRSSFQKAPAKIWNGIWEAVEFANRGVEDITRFTVYMTSRQQGRTVARSVKDAKDITVNFNKKGSGGYLARFMNFAYIFFNATIQSADNFIGLMKNNPKKMMTALGSIGMAGVAMPLLAIAMQSLCGGGDGDDDNPTYWDLPEWVRHSNFVFYVPFSKGGFITIPVPHELRPFLTVGESAVALVSGKAKVEDAMKACLEGFTNLMPLDITGNGGDIVITSTPTFVQPFVQVARNTSFFGTPIYKKNDYNALDPDWTKAYRSTAPWLVKGTKWLSSATQSNPDLKGIEPGAIDLNPAVIEYLFESYLGGVGKTVNRTSKTVGMLWNEDLRQWRNVPVASSFVQQVDERSSGSSVNSMYYDMYDDYKRVQHNLQRMKSYAKRDGGKSATEMMEKMAGYSKSEEYRRYLIMDPYIKAINKYNSAIKDLPDDQKEIVQQKVTELKKQMIQKVQDRSKN